MFEKNGKSGSFKLTENQMYRGINILMVHAVFVILNNCLTCVALRGMHLFFSHRQYARRTAYMRLSYIPETHLQYASRICEILETHVYGASRVLNTSNVALETHLSISRVRLW